ncbi:unnamed protein product [Spirodela intermedia]|uniref:Uncharacterized protein n=1 Tax=Spirodela intermedia TaxID=51605 RepID=A0A7I8IMW7_SPIIN|nr:unnamed protein product [Spirodela intermedia]CAA6659139.1 unnamed protein product [Spirodela intermedia]
MEREDEPGSQWFPAYPQCYEYEKKNGNQFGPQFKMNRILNIIHLCFYPSGRPPVRGEEPRDGGADDSSDSNHPSRNQDQKQKIAERMLSWRMNYGAEKMVIDSSREFSGGLGNVAWKERVDGWKMKQDKSSVHGHTMTNGTSHAPSEGRGTVDIDATTDYNMDDALLNDEARQPLSRKVPIPSSRINPYRMVIILRLFILSIFLHYRLTNPVRNAYPLWLLSVICEIWFAISWILDQFPKWFPINRETYLDRLSLRYDREGEPSQLAAVDIFVSTLKHRICSKWVPFCKKYTIEPRAPEWYFAQKVDYLKDKVHPSFVKDRRAMKREYEEFKVRVNGLVAKAQKIPDEGWIMQDGTPWPGNNTRDHPGMIQVFLGQNGGLDTDGNELPRLVYVSREKRPGFQHHKKAGAMNALVRVSAVLTNGPYLLNLDCDHYINNSKALREAMCFLMDPNLGGSVCYVQFLRDSMESTGTIINLRGLDGIQGPVYVGTGCVFNRTALYGYEPPVKNKKKNNKASFSHHAAVDQGRRAQSAGFDDEKSLIMSQMSLEKRFGQSSVFVASTLMENGGVPQSATPDVLLKEAIHVISCGYEDKSDWGSEIGWIYGSVTEDILTGFKMHARGWRSIYCMPNPPAFKGSAPINLSDRLNQVLRWALGSVEILLSRHCPIWYGYGGRLKFLERFAYVNTTIYPVTAIPLIIYCTLPAICLLTGKFIIPQISNFASIWFISLFLSIFATGILEMRWSGVGIEEWWRNEQFWVIGGVSAHLFAVFQGSSKCSPASTPTSPSPPRPPTRTATLQSSTCSSGRRCSSPHHAAHHQPRRRGRRHLLRRQQRLPVMGALFGKLFFAFWVIVHLYPFLKGLMGRQNRTPTIVVVWSILLASIFSSCGSALTHSPPGSPAQTWSSVASTAREELPSQSSEVAFFPLNLVEPYKIPYTHIHRERERERGTGGGCL